MLLKFGCQFTILISNAERPKALSRRVLRIDQTSRPDSPMDLEQLLQTRAFLDEMSASIRNILLACFPDMTPQEKDDIDNEVKLKLWKKAACGKKIDNLRSYLWRVVYTTALDLLGERMNHLSLEKIVETSEKGGLAPQEILSPDFALQSNELKLMIEKALDSLPERRKAVLQLHLAGLDIQKIAFSLTWSENQVRHLLYRGLEDLRVRINKGIKSS